MKTTTAPISYLNWQAMLSGEPWLEIYEYPLFTDAYIIGEITQELGPYQILNNVPMDSGRPALILRSQKHIKFEIPDMNETQAAAYHGGYEQDEIAALLSLCLGIRIKAGSANRIFSNSGDPKGRPITLHTSRDPILPISRSSQGYILKSALGEHSLADIHLFQTFYRLSQEQANSVIRAARLYQDAIWIVESAPELSWIMLVSTVEVIANQWRPPKIRVKQKFIDFLLEFLPKPPAERPYLFAQHLWEKDAFSETFSSIYKYRSRALHDGSPFPAPMCSPPMPAGEKGEFEEILSALSASMKGSVWAAKDIPITLHTFEYIARNAILNWWQEMVKA